MIDSRPDLRLSLRDRAIVVALLAGAVALAAVVFDATPLLRGPAPYPPEWRWELRRGDTSGRFLPAIAGGAALAGLLALLAGERDDRRRARVAVAAAVPLGLAFQLALLAIEPDGALRTLVQRTMSRTVTSYYTVAVSPMAQDPRAFLARHHELLLEMRHGAKHASTHPPGPVLFYRGLLALFDARPRLAQWTIDAAGLADPERRPAARATALAGPLLILLACALTAWPVAALARGTGMDEAASARAGVLWALLPGPALMAPQFDQALALPVTLAAAALALAVRAEHRAARVAWRFVCGAAVAVAASLSYGAAVFIGLAGAATLAAVADRARARVAVKSVALAAIVAAALLEVPLLLGHRPWRSAFTALAMHRETFTAPRGYALWLAFNPLDLAVFLGPPLAVLFAVRLAQAARRQRAHASEGLDRFTLAAGAGLLLLLLSGTVRGEVGRIWIPLMPLLAIPAASRVGAGWRGPILGAILAALCILLRTRWELG
jgi:hypothetical protein